MHAKYIVIISTHCCSEATEKRGKAVKFRRVTGHRAGVACVASRNIFDSRITRYIVSQKALFLDTAKLCVVQVYHSDLGLYKGPLAP